jgi:uncharacterized protein DUF4019
MRRREFVTTVGILSAATLAPGRLSAAETPENAAKAAADAWLALFDKGQYAESWEQAAKQFKGAVTQEKWKEAATAVRTSLGKVVSRKLKSRQLTDSLPGAPPGRYVIIEYDTEFEKKPAAVEVVTPMAQPDGAWRVSGYFIR